MNNIFKSINDLDYLEQDLDIIDDDSNLEDDELEGETLECLEEIKLYDPCKTREENFNDGSWQKHLLFSVTRNGNLSIDTRIPDQFSKVVVDLNTIEEYSVPEFVVVDFDSLFGVRLTSFIKYKSEFLSCDERVFFEALLIKYKAFGHNAFFWSKEMIWKEIGIKKDRAAKIAKRFVEIGILEMEVKKSVLNGRPQQITYYEPIGSRIMELIPTLFGDRHDDGFISELQKYLNFQPSHSNNRLL